MDYTLKTLLQCSADQARALVDAYRDAHGWHAETVIAAAGALVGHAIQTSAYSMAAQGTLVVSEFERPTNPPFGKFINCAERIEIYIDNELGFLTSVAAHFDWFKPQDVPEMAAIVAQCIDQIGGAWFPQLSVASEHMPHKWPPDAVPRFTQPMRAHLDRYGLPRNMCEVLCLSLALGHLIGKSRDRLDPAIALRIGLEMAIATASIGNLDRTYIASQFEGSGESSHEPAEIELPHGEPLSRVNETAAVQSTLPMASDDIDVEELYPDLLANILLNGTDEMPVPIDEDEDMRDLERDEDDSLSLARTSRLSRERSKSTAFGKRQIA